MASSPASCSLSLVAWSTTARTHATCPSWNGCACTKSFLSRLLLSSLPDWLQWDFPASADLSPNCRCLLAPGVHSQPSQSLPVSAFSSAWPTPFAPCKGLSFHARQRSRRPPPARPLSNQPTRMRPLLRYLCLSGWELHC